MTTHQDTSPNVSSLLTPYLRARLGRGELDPRTMELMSYKGSTPALGHPIPPYLPGERRRRPLARTVVIPVEQVTESPRRVWRVLFHLKKACAQLGPTEVVIWFNSSFQHALSQAGPEFDYWLTQLKASSLFSPDFRIRAVHRFRIAGDNFNQIRSCYMDAVAVDCLGRYLSPDYVVWWLDADSPFITAKAIHQAEAALALGLGHLAHASLKWCGWHGTNLERMSPAEKIAYLYGHARWMLESNLPPTAPRGFYLEESGTVMTLRAYLLSGGVSTLDPLRGESRTLLANAAKAQAEGELNPGVPLMYHVAGTIGYDNRRIVEIARSHEAWRIPGSEEGPEYAEYLAGQANGSAPNAPRRADLDEVHEMVRRTDALHQLRTGIGLTSQQAASIRRWIKRHLSI
jgi:hypothetical protein